ncbi:MAG: hypothetical protein SOX56_06915 [[Pasteurella] mairii]|nr:hypothetical protein [[Pasteurella] mairii]
MDLTDSTEFVQEVSYPDGIYRLNRYFPAKTPLNSNDKYSSLSQLSLDQIAIGEMFVKKSRILICAENACSHPQILRNTTA